MTSGPVAPFFFSGFGEGFLFCGKGQSVSAPSVNLGSLQKEIVKPVRPQLVQLSLPTIQLPSAPAAPTYQAPALPTPDAPATEYHGQVMDARWRALNSRRRAGYLQQVFAGETGGLKTL